MHKLTLLLLIFCLSCISTPKEKTTALDSPSISKENQSQEANTYKNLEQGFQVTKPNHWSFLSEKDLEESLKKTKFENQKLKEALLKDLSKSLPAVSISSLKRTGKDINPTFSVNTQHLGALKGMSEEVLTQFLFEGMKHVFNGYQYIVKPKDITFKGQKGKYVKASYSHSEGKLAVVESWIFLRNQKLTTISATVAKEDEAKNKKEFTKILNSFKFL